MFVLCKIVEVFEELARSRDVDDLPIVPNLCRVRRNLGQFDEPSRFRESDLTRDKYVQPSVFWQIFQAHFCFWC